MTRFESEARVSVGLRNLSFPATSRLFTAPMQRDTDSDALELERIFGI